MNRFCAAKNFPAGIRSARAPRVWALTIALLLGAIGIASTSAQEPIFPEKPEVSKGVWIVDNAAMIGPAEAGEINALASALMKEQKVPLLVVTLPSLLEMNAAHLTVERYASALFDHWGIGSERRNYGMLLLVSRDDRKARIELGAAWAGQHDADAKQVMETLIIPAFRRGDFSGGILAGTRGMDAMARGLQLPVAKAPWWTLPVFFGLLLVTIGVVVSLFRSGRKGWGWALLAALGVLLFFMLRASARGGGGAFGGGSSGGGGATGSW